MMKQPSRSDLIDWRILLFATILILHFANTFGDLFNRPPTTELFVEREGPNPLYTYSYLVVQIIALMFLIPVHVAVGAVVKRNLWIPVLGGLALVSCVWSLMPYFSLRRSIALLGSFAAVIFLAVRIPPRTYMKILLWMALLFIFSTPVIVFALPAWGKGTGMYADAWRGITAHKNGLGWMMVLSVVTMLYTRRMGLVSRPVVYAALPVALVNLIMTKSGTSYLAMIFALALMGVLAVMKRLPGLKAIASGVLVCLAGAAVLLADTVKNSVLLALGKDTTLTGRTVIWDRLFEAIAQRPVFGFGYRAFWESPYAIDLMTISGFFAGHSHNGYIDFLLDMGAVGLIILLGVSVWALAKLVTASIKGDSFAEVQLILMSVCLFIGLSGPVVFRPNTIYFIFTCLPVIYASSLRNHKSNRVIAAVPARRARSPRFPQPRPVPRIRAR